MVFIQLKVVEINNAHLDGNICSVADVHKKMWMPIAPTVQWLLIIYFPKTGKCNACSHSHRPVLGLCVTTA